MAPGQKKKEKLNPTEKKVFNYWVWLFILGPAAFFVYYLLFQGGSGLAPGKKADIPQDYRAAGVAVAVAGGSLTAAPGGGVYYSEKIVIGYNKIVSEASTIFAVIPLAAPKGFGEPAQPQWYIAGGDGSKYNLLKALKENPITGKAQADVTDYLIFKIDRDQRDNFLIYSAGNYRAAWKLPPRTD